VASPDAADTGGRQRPLCRHGNAAEGRKRHFDSVTSGRSIDPWRESASPILEWPLRYRARMTGRSDRAPRHGGMPLADQHPDSANIRGGRAAGSAMQQAATAA
jgi:hypothetical protein